MTRRSTSKVGPQAQPMRNNGPVSCKTCTSCRQRKIKCSGRRPRCDECTAGDLACVYPHDARRQPRASRSRVDVLEATLAAVIEHVRASGLDLPMPDDMVTTTTARPDDDGDETTINTIMSTATAAREPRRPENVSTAAVAPLSAAVPFPSPAASSTTTHMHLGRPDPFDMDHMPADHDLDMRLHSQHSGVVVHESGEMDVVVANEQHQHQHQQQQQEQDPLAPSSSTSSSPVDPTSSTIFVASSSDPPSSSSSSSSSSDAAADTALSTCEARVAGVYHEGGRVSSVHGLSGIINPTRRHLHKANISKVLPGGESAVAASRARLISHAALQRQREGAIFFSSSSSRRNQSRQQQQQQLDLLDGCEPSLARHLILDVHFARQDFPNLATYRPAVMSGLARGGGPWVNKLLVNAIYYSSAQYSDDPRVLDDNKNTRGAVFYSRFRKLLVSDDDDDNAGGGGGGGLLQPSVASAAAMLLVSSALVSQGRIGEGWTLAGLAYRMVIDLGCHLMLPPDYRTVGEGGGGGGGPHASHANNHDDALLQCDMEHEARKRLYWTAYVTDVTQSLYLGRPCMFANVEARVPLRFLDTFEELETWRPPRQQQQQQPFGHRSSSRDDEPSHDGMEQSQSAHTLSTLTSLAKLMRIGRVISDLYGIQAMKHDSQYILETRASIEQRLQDWSSALPRHLHFDPQVDPCPPPRQLILHTTHHVLHILLNRAFTEEGHLRRHSDASMKRRSESACLAGAVAIRRCARAYREASFSSATMMRGAPLLLCYAVYSAAMVLLAAAVAGGGGGGGGDSGGDEKHGEGVVFLWRCLRELQGQGVDGDHGGGGGGGGGVGGFGLEKPMTVLEGMMRDEGLLPGEEGGREAMDYSQGAQQQQQQQRQRQGGGGTVGQSMFSQTVNGQYPALLNGSHGGAEFMGNDGGGELAGQYHQSQRGVGYEGLGGYTTPSYLSTNIGEFDFGFESPSCEGVPDFLTDEEWTLSQNNLYGLFSS